MLEPKVLDQAYEYVNNCLDYTSSPRDMRTVVQEVILMAEPYIRRDAVMEAAEHLELPGRHLPASFSARAHLALYAAKEFREATTDELPDEQREEAERLEKLATALEHALNLPGGDEKQRARTEKWIERLYLRAYNLRGERP